MLSKAPLISAFVYSTCQRGIIDWWHADG